MVDRETDLVTAEAITRFQTWQRYSERLTNGWTMDQASAMHKAELHLQGPVTAQRLQTEQDRLTQRIGHLQAERNTLLTQVKGDRSVQERVTELRGRLLILQEQRSIVASALDLYKANPSLELGGRPAGFAEKLETQYKRLCERGIDPGLADTVREVSHLMGERATVNGIDRHLPELVDAHRAVCQQLDSFAVQVRQVEEARRLLPALDAARTELNQLSTGHRSLMRLVGVGNTTYQQAVAQVETYEQAVKANGITDQTQLMRQEAALERRLATVEPMLTQQKRQLEVLIKALEQTKVALNQEQQHIQHIHRNGLYTLRPAHPDR